MPILPKVCQIYNFISFWLKFYPFLISFVINWSLWKVSFAPLLKWDWSKIN
jgi:hypothetical protein